MRIVCCPTHKLDPVNGKPGVCVVTRENPPLGCTLEQIIPGWTHFFALILSRKLTFSSAVEFFFTFVEMNLIDEARLCINVSYRHTRIRCVFATHR